MEDNAQADATPSCKNVDTAPSRENVDSAPSRKEAVPTSPLPDFHYFDPDKPIEFLSGRLPHWRQDNVMYFITFHQADSIPQEKLRQWIIEQERWHKAHPEPLTPELRRDYHKKFTVRKQYWLDQGYGSCALVRPEIKYLVEDTIRHFAGERYILDEYVVASNHVHALLAPVEGHTLYKRDPRKNRLVLAEGILRSYSPFRSISRKVPRIYSEA